MFTKHRDHAVRAPTPNKPYDTKKPLSVVWEQHKQFNATNTVMLDDSPLKARDVRFACNVIDWMFIVI